ncbi:MAG: outer membrane protein assembly factor BamD [Planctomycetaceae bacterium]|nr:outer membrane protein assembly factor BamD [Planctomycetaceae bacterium]
MLILSCAAMLFSGCQAFSNSSLSALSSTKGIRGPLERSLSAETPLEAGQRYSEEAQRLVETAQTRFDAKDYEAAEKIYKKVAKKYKESSVGEQAQFGLAETYYANGELAKAQDAYDQLFVDYPSTRYVEPASRRLFAIARRWMEISDPVAKSEIRQVSSETAVPDSSKPVAPSNAPSLKYRILPNFTDSSRPMFDTQGRALQALKAIWMNDPTGPLADDALMLTATYHQRRKNYVEADRYYKILREEYPDSPHFEKAYLLGSHVKLMSYQGSYYEGGDLEAAAKLKEQSLHLFPASEQRGAVREDLQKIYLLQAQRAWDKVQYAQRKGRPRAVAIGCIQLIADFPDTKFAAEARNLLGTIDPATLDGLPEIEEYLKTIPNTRDPRNGQGSGPPTRSVSDSRAEEPAGGRVRL